MNTKRRIKQRREERIRRLMDGAVHEVLQEQKPVFIGTHKENEV